jgi:hypothetical protein
MSRTRKSAAALLALAAIGMSSVPVAFANPNEGPGNGGGQSGQCTGPQALRPASCTSQGGPGDQGSN